MVFPEGKSEPVFMQDPPVPPHPVPRVADAPVAPVISQESQALRRANFHLAASMELLGKIQLASNVQGACECLAEEILLLLNDAEATVSIATFQQADTRRSRGEALELQVTLPAPPREQSQGQLIQSSMHEALAKGKLLVVSSRSGSPPSTQERCATLSHQRLLTQQKCGNIVTLPLLDSSGTAQAVLQIGCTAKQTAQWRTFLEASATPLADALRLQKRCERSWLYQKVNKLRQALSGSSRKWLSAIFLLLALIACVPVPYRLPCRCEVIPTQKRFVCAPFAAPLKDTFVEPGDVVQANQLLTILDGQATKLELAEVRAELQRAASQRDGYTATHQLGNAKLAQLEVERLNAKRELLRNRLANLEITSPQDGIILAGDLKLSQGKPVETGESLFEIAPLDQLAIEVAIAEEEIRFVREGQPVSIQLGAFPFQTFEGTVQRVYPDAQTYRDEHVFFARVPLTELPPSFRPGMAGHAKIQCDQQSIGWIWTHKSLAQLTRWLGW